MTTANLIGEFVDANHRVDELLGEGGFGTVYLGTDVGSGRRVAIKFLDPELQQSVSNRARFEREIQAVGQLRSPNTVMLYGHGTTAEGQRYIIFEYVEGRDLTDILSEDGPMQTEHVVHVLRLLLGALEEAHHHGILHRDIKPANIRITTYLNDPWFPKLLDFGIARFVDPDEANLTKTGELLGTPRYMSPEQLLSGELTPASDIYTLGMVAFEMWKGRDILPGNRLNDQFDRLRSGHVFAAEGTVEDVHLMTVIEEMTQRNPEKRPQSAQAVLAMLDAPPPKARDSPPEDPTNKLPEDPTNKLPERRRRPPPTRPARPPGRAPLTNPDGEVSPAKAGLVLAAVFAAVLVLGVVLLTEGSPEPPSSDRVTSVVPQAASPGTLPTSTRDGGATEDGEEVNDMDLDHAPAPPQNGCGLEVERGKQLARGNHVVYFPTSYSVDTPTPVVLMFHKPFHTGDRLIEDSNVLKHAEKSGYIVLAPTAQELTAGFQPADKATLAEALTNLHLEACVDSGRIFAVTHGDIAGEFLTGLPCSFQLAAAARFADGHRAGVRLVSLNTCSTATPTIRLSGMKDKYIPPDGGAGCLGGQYLSLSKTNELWREKNSCQEESETWLVQKGQRCTKWSCETPYVSCELAGGRDWPRGLREKFEMPGCPSPAADFPVTATIFRFFEEVGRKESRSDSPFGGQGRRR